MISLSVRGDVVVSSVGSPLPPDRFRAYLAACSAAGARFERTPPRHVFGRGHLISFRDAISAAGIESCSSHDDAKIDGGSEADDDDNQRVVEAKKNAETGVQVARPRERRRKKIGGDDGNLNEPPRLALRVCSVCGGEWESMANPGEVACVNGHSEARENVGEPLAVRPYQREGIDWLRVHPCTLLGDQPGLGKGHPVSTRVLTPTGWSEIGGLKVGDQVIGSSGEPVIVTDVFDRGILPVVKVTFSDESSVLCDLDHLWNVQSREDVKAQKWRVVSTQELLTRGLRYGGEDDGRRKFRIPLVGPVRFPIANVPLDHYVLGVLLGDGSLTSNTPQFTKNDHDLAENVARRLPAGHEVRKKPQADRADSYSICSSKFVPGIRDSNAVQAALRGLGLDGLESHERFVPSCFLWASPEQRMDLLRGLMDTDGSVTEHDGHVEFGSSSRNLAESVQFLVRSFGGTAKIVTRDTWFAVDGERKEGRLCHRVSISWPGSLPPPFSIKRKLDAFKPKIKYGPIRLFDSMEPAGSARVVCIQVSAADQLYVTESFIVTHNTLQGLRAAGRDVPILVVCPASVKNVWRDEAAKFRPDLGVTVLSGRFVRLCTEHASGRESLSKKGRRAKPANAPPEDEEEAPRKLDSDYKCSECPPRKKLPAVGKFAVFRWPRPNEVVVINTEIFPKGWSGAPRGLRVIADEAHAYAYADSARTRRIRSLVVVALKAGGGAWAFTGTPMANAPNTLWCLLVTFQLHPWATNDEFVAAFGGVRDSWGKLSWPEKPPTDVQSALRPFMLRRLKTDVLHDLPPLTIQDVVVDVDARARGAGDKVLAMLAELGLPIEALIDAEEKADFAATALDPELRKKLTPEQWAEARHRLLALLAEAREALVRAKLPAILEWIENTYESSGEQLVVFSAHRIVVETLRDRPGWAGIIGGMTSGQREDVLDRFVSGSVRCITATIRTIGVGINKLVGCSNVVLADWEYLPLLNSQAIDRHHRIGQKNPVLVRRFVADHDLDRRVLAALDKKEALQRAVLGG